MSIGKKDPMSSDLSGLNAEYDGPRREIAGYEAVSAAVGKNDFRRQGCSLKFAKDPMLSWTDTPVV